MRLWTIRGKAMPFTPFAIAATTEQVFCPTSVFKKAVVVVVVGGGGGGGMRGGHSGHLGRMIKATCSDCHDPHGVVDDGVSGDHTHLINFDRNVVSPMSGYTTPIYKDLGKFSGSCTLLCHNHHHRDATYP